MAAAFLSPVRPTTWPSLPTSAGGGAGASSSSLVTPEQLEQRRYYVRRLQLAQGWSRWHHVYLLIRAAGIMYDRKQRKFMRERLHAWHEAAVQERARRSLPRIIDVTSYFLPRSRRRKLARGINAFAEA